MIKVLASVLATALLLVGVAGATHETFTYDPPPETGSVAYDPPPVCINPPPQTTAEGDTLDLAERCSDPAPVQVPYTHDPLPREVTVPHEDAPPPPPPPPPTTNTLSIYEGPGDTAEVNSFAAWLGRQPAFVLDYIPNNSGWSGIENPQWLFSAWASFPESEKRLVLSLPPFPNSLSASTAYSQCASGSFNARYATLGRLAVQNNRPRTIWRIAWEYNGTWMHWSAPNDSVNYAACFRQIVTSLRSAVGQQFEFDWTPNEGVPVNTASYPGDAHVDYVGSDAFDPGPRSNRTFDQMIADSRWGLQVQKDFADSHGKKISFAEWGLWNQDNPNYIDRMADWFSSVNLGYQSYFNEDGCSACAANHRLNRPEFDASEARYKARFGS